MARGIGSVLSATYGNRVSAEIIKVYRHNDVW